jgi:hypothetical protein
MYNNDKMDEKIIAKKVANLLRLIAEEIERHPELLKDLNLTMEEVPIAEKKKKTSTVVEMNVFEIYSEKGEEGLKSELEKLSIPQLNYIIRQNVFDPTKLSQKWKKKDKLIDLIVNKVKSRTEKGRVFMDYD